MTIETISAEAAYVSKSNIVHPGTAAQVAAAEVKGRADIAAVLNVTSVTGGAIKKA